MTISTLQLRPSDAKAASELARRVFDAFVAPDYSAEGGAIFHAFVSSELLSTKLESGEMLGWGAFCEGRLVGVLVMRSPNHITLLFVDKEYHRQGVARRLFALCCQTCGVGTITVNSSPYALDVYLRLGFRTTAHELTSDGIRYTPMEYTL